MIHLLHSNKRRFQEILFILLFFFSQNLALATITATPHRVQGESTGILNNQKEGNDRRPRLSPSFQLEEDMFKESIFLVAFEEESSNQPGLYVSNIHYITPILVRPEGDQSSLEDWEEIPPRKFYASYFSWMKKIKKGTLGQKIVGWTYIKSDETGFTLNKEHKLYPTKEARRNFELRTTESFNLNLKKTTISDGIIYLRVKENNIVYTLTREGIVTSTSTTINSEWEDVVILSPCASIEDRIVFLSTLSGNGDLYIIGPENNIATLRRITFTDGLEMSPAWSPDGRTIAYSLRQEKEGRNRDIYIVEIGTDSSSLEPKRLTDSPAVECNPTWSPDGEMIAYYSINDEQKYDLWVMRRDGSQKRMVASDVSQNEDYGPCWVPYGTSTLIYIYGDEDKLEMQNVISTKKEIILTNDRMMQDVDCIRTDNEIYLAYSALLTLPSQEGNRGWEKIFIRLFQLETSNEQQSR